MGGVVSPLLANIALHGLETTVLGAYSNRLDRPKVVRYADDFVILHPTLEGIDKARGIVEQWLGDMGLNLKASKTRVVHTRRTLNDQGAGFDFLGFVRHEVAHMAVTTEQLGRNLVFYHQYPTGTCGRSNAAV